METKKLEEALFEYATVTEDRTRIPELVEYLKSHIKDIAKYVNKLSQSQLKGKMPILSGVQRKPNFRLVQLELYWDPEKACLDFEWNDTRNFW